MPLYFMLHNNERFQSLIRPALAACWRQRSFDPCCSLRLALADDFERFVTENHIRPEEMTMLRIRPDTLFDRDLWRMATGEVLLAAAAEVPEIPTAEETLVRLLGDEPSITHAYHGTSGLIFGGGWYRPDHAGINDRADVERLADFLSSLPWEGRTDADLDMLSESGREADLRDELAYARAALPPLQAMYQRARAHHQIIICETI
jgi:hypothetical protein